MTLQQFIEAEREATANSYFNGMEGRTEFGAVLNASHHRLIAKIREWVDENEYCSKCCSPKKFCNKWGASASGIDTKDLLTLLDVTKPL